MIAITFGVFIIFLAQIELSYCVQGGQIAKPNDFPSQVAIIVTYGNEADILCGGTIIDENHVVTAASCVCIDNELVATKRVSVQAGSVLLSKNTEKLNVAAIFYHKSFDSKTFENDIAVIRMVNKFDNYTINDPNAIVTSAPLQDEIVQDMTPCRVAGWNPTDMNVDTPLNFLEIVTLNREKECNAATNYGGKVLDKMLCAGDAQPQTKPTGVCPSNRGGGLYCKGRLAGILSFGMDCGKTKKPGVYTQVRGFTEWIDEKLKDNSVPNDGNNGNNGTNGNNGNQNPVKDSATSISLAISSFVGLLFCSFII